MFGLIDAERVELFVLLLSLCKQLLIRVFYGLVLNLAGRRSGLLRLPETLLDEVHFDLLLQRSRLLLSRRLRVLTLPFFELRR